MTSNFYGLFESKLNSQLKAIESKKILPFLRRFKKSDKRRQIWQKNDEKL